jgi:hypothetical protein
MVELNLARKRRSMQERSLHWCHFVQHKFPMNTTGTELRLEKPAFKHLSYTTDTYIVYIHMQIVNIVTENRFLSSKQNSLYSRTPASTFFSAA